LKIFGQHYFKKKSAPSFPEALLNNRNNLIEIICYLGYLITFVVSVLFPWNLNKYRPFLKLIAETESFPVAGKL
jgi:hypothetical protein